MIKFYLFTSFFFFISSFFHFQASPSKQFKDFIIKERDLIPEGLAFDCTSQKIFVSSTHKCKIICIDSSGKITDFISEGQDGVKSVIGMKVDAKRRCLWAVSSEAADVLPLTMKSSKQWQSSVYRFSLDDGRLIKKYLLERDSVFLNDLTVAADGTVYVTESLHNNVYKLDPRAENLQLFISLHPYTFINGICFANNKSKLFVSSTEGIVSIDLKTRNSKLLPVSDSNKALSIDGLSFVDNYFIGHQSKMVCRFYIAPDWKNIVRVDTLDSRNEFDGSTTGNVGEGYYYYIVNSQIRSGIDFVKRMIKPIDSLEDVIIRKTRL